MGNAMLEEIKKRLQITGTYMDDMLSGYIEDAKQYLVNAGADPDSLEEAYGVIAKGVFDMWTRESFSPIFYDMATQFVISNHRSEE